MPSTGPLEDRIAIRELMEAYADAVFRHDADAWSDCWVQDATWALPQAEVKGRDNMVGAWKSAMTGFPFAGFFVFPGVVTVEGDKATSRSYTQEHLILTDGGVRKIVGEYNDDLRKEGGRWRFAVRRYTVLHEDKS